MTDQIEQQATAIRSLRRALQDLAEASQAVVSHLDYAAKLTADLNMPHLSGNFNAARKDLGGKILIADLTAAMRGLPACTMQSSKDLETGPYKPDSAQQQIDFWKLRAGMSADQVAEQRIEIADLRAHLLSERRQKDAAQARADQAEKRLAAAKAGA